MPKGYSSQVNSEEAAYQLSEDELSIIVDYEEENQRLGNFERIYPLA